MSPEFRPDGVYGTPEERLEEDTRELLLREHHLGVSFLPGLLRLPRLRRPRRKRERVVSWDQIAATYALLASEEPEKRISQADVARRLTEPVRNIERTCDDHPGAWAALTRR